VEKKQIYTKCLSLISEEILIQSSWTKCGC